MPLDISYREMKVEDIKAGLDLCRFANWNQLQQDWQNFLELNPSGSIVAIKENIVIGTATTIQYGDKFSWIGMVLVHPDHKKQGIGQHLLKESIALLHHQKTIKLDATAAGRLLYLKLNFKDEYVLNRMIASRLKTSENGIGVKKISALVIEKICAYDKNIFGADRSFLLRRLYESNPQWAFYSENNDQINGFCLGRKGFRYTHLGPLIADNVNTAKSLASAAFRECAETNVAMDIFTHLPEWIEWIKSIGFTEERSFMRMYLGENNFEGSIDKQFAIVGPEFG